MGGGGGPYLTKTPKYKGNIKRREEETNSSISSFSNGFTLVELLAVLAILAIILLIAVPKVLGMIEEAKVKSFRDSVLSLFHSIEMNYMETGIKEGTIPNLDLNNNRFLTGTYTIDTNGDIILNQVCDGTYKANVVYNKAREDFEIEKDNGTCDTNILILGKNPETVSCSSTKRYTDQGAKYNGQTLTSNDTVNLTKAGMYQLHYTYGEYQAIRVVNVMNDHIPTITLKQESVTIYKGDMFDASLYLESAKDECEGDITNKVQSVSSVLTDVPGTYEVIYKVKNLGNKEGTKTLKVTVKELPLIELVMPTIDGENGWYKTSQIVTVKYDSDILDGYEYAISTDNGNTYKDYINSETKTFSLNENSGTIKIKVRGKRGAKYTELVTSDTIKMDTKTPELVRKAESYHTKKGSSYDISNLYTVTYGASHGSTVCKIGTSSITNINTLSSGKYNLSCVATSKAGNTKEISITLEIEQRDLVLNGADPVIKGDLIPITIANDGTVKKADSYTNWYNYTKKEWANAIILMDKTKIYNTGDIIPESNIESYFVWIPRYKYKIFDEGNYNGFSESQESKAQTIEIIFENKTVAPSNGSKVGEYLTHPAFTNFDTNGIWVGKFELGYKGATTTQEAQKTEVDATKVVAKPNAYSWRSNTVKNFFETIYNYNRILDSHMMKNTEWGSVTYLSHSKYGRTDATGKNIEIGINNNSSFLTGCGDEPASAKNTICNTYKTEKGLLASTTGNITGIYDMAGGSFEYVAGYRANTYGTSGFDATSIAIYDSKYFDVYNENSNTTTYQYRILGDATGEQGSFNNLSNYNKGSWYTNSTYFVTSARPWFVRGDWNIAAYYAGIFNFSREYGAAQNYISSRIVLLSY